MYFKIFKIKDNLLGSGKDTDQFTTVLNEFFTKNIEVIHLDLSWNKFDYP